MAPPALVTLVSRDGCGLCQELARDLRRLGVAFDLLDVDSDPDLTKAYSDYVPVLMKDGTELARAPFTEASLRQALRKAAVLL